MKEQEIENIKLDNMRMLSMLDELVSHKTFPSHLPTTIVKIKNLVEGILANNHWFKINSESDLPDDNGYYFVLIYRECKILEFFNNGKVMGFLLEGETYINKYEDLHITHYQPIIKPLPPTE